MNASPQVLSQELQNRLGRFRAQMEITAPSWEVAVVFSKINLYYFTGTMQEGMLWVPRNNEAVFFVRRSYERAKEESQFPSIVRMENFREAAEIIGKIPQTVNLEMEFVPLAMYQRFQKYFPFKEVKPLEPAVSVIRSLKSPYEISQMEEAGRIHQRVLENLVPDLLKEGMSEAELAAELFSVMVREGHQGISRFGMFDTEMILGHVAFGESSIYPTSFNGPGGNYGMGSAVPSLGSRHRKLQKGDLVFVDVGCGVNGYHTDKTMTYMYGKPLPQEAIEAHRQCINIQHRTAALLKPGAIPSEIYNSIMNSLPPSFLENFMGYGNRQVKFLGHGIGLTIDELPVIAPGFDKPLEEGMVFAIEPKKGIKDIGMVGIENTFVVTPSGGRCITGTNEGLIEV